MPVASTLTIRRRRLHPQRVLSLVYALFFVTGIGQSAIVPLLPRIGTLYGLSPSQTALLLALPGLATLAASMPSGLLADRFGARRVTLAAGALLCLSGVAQAAPSLAVLLAGRLAFGISFGVVWTAGMAWLSEIDFGTRGSRLGPSVTFSSVGVMLGPAVGGLLAERAGLAVPFVAITAAAAAVTGALWLGSPAPRRGGQGSAADRPVTAQASIRMLPALLRRPGVGAAACALIVSGAVSGTAQLLITLGLHRRGVSTAGIGLAFSVSSVFYIATSGVVARSGERARNLRFNALATLILALALVPAFADGAPAALVLALMLAAVPRAAVSTVAYALATPRDSARGTGEGEAAEGFVFGLLNGGWAAAMVLMPLLVGALDQHEGARAAYLAAIVPSLAIAFWLLGAAREGGIGRGAEAELYCDLGAAGDSEPEPASVA